MKLLSLLIPVVALLGILDASYITYEKISGVIPPCLPGFACARVLTSPWANIGPVPLSVLGILFYTSVLIVSGAVFLEKRSLFPLLLLQTRFGLLFSLYLVTIMQFVIKGWCLWCLFSALICILLFLLTHIMLAFQSEKERRSAYPLQFAVISFAYTHVLKPVLFLTNAETVHHVFLLFGSYLGMYPWTRSLIAWMFSYRNPSLTKKIAGISFPNPVGLAAGFDYDGVLPRILPSVGFGFATIGTVTLQPYQGNPSPMLDRLQGSKALLVNKGFKSEGAVRVIARLSGKKFAIPIGISIGSTNRMYAHLHEQIDNILECFRLFEKSRVKHSYYELNISCPNTTGGQPFTDTARLDALLTKLDKLSIKKPVFVKMPIDKSVAQTLTLLERIAQSKTITGIVIGNLTKDHANPDVTAKDRVVWDKRAGNLSGKPTWKRSNALIRATAQKFGKRFVIIGTGGIFSPEDAKEKMRLGADLVQLITGMIYEGPTLLGDISWYLSRT